MEVKLWVFIQELLAFDRAPFICDYGDCRRLQWNTKLFTSKISLHFYNLVVGGLDRLTRDDNKYFLSYPDQPQQQQQRFSINPDRDYNSAYIQAGPNNQYNGMDNGHQSWQNGYNQPNIKTIRQSNNYLCIPNKVKMHLP